MSPTGRFGIGFFSVFMISHVVHVTSKRYDHALDSTGILEFRSGLSLRPILRPASDEEVIHDGGTRVSARLDEAFLSKEGYLARSGWIDKRGRPDLARLVQAICPNVDVNVQVEHGGLISDCVSAGDWTDMPGDLLLSRLTKPNSSGAQLRTYGNLLRPLTDGTVLYGRACVLGFGPYYWNADIGGVVTVGGLAASELSGIGGVLVGSTDVVTRDQAVPDVPFSVLRLWADEQGRLVAQSDLSEDEKLCAAAVVMKCGGSPGALPVCTSGGDYLDAG
jgi:hypothetical protein